MLPLNYRKTCYFKNVVQLLVGKEEEKALSSDKLIYMLPKHSCLHIRVTVIRPTWKARTSPWARRPHENKAFPLTQGIGGQYLPSILNLFPASHPVGRDEAEEHPRASWWSFLIQVVMPQARFAYSKLCTQRRSLPVSWGPLRTGFSPGLPLCFYRLKPFPSWMSWPSLLLSSPLL